MTQPSTNETERQFPPESIDGHIDSDRVGHDTTIRTATNCPVTQLIRNRIATSGKTQSELSKEMGIAAPNFLSMIKTGRSKLPDSKWSVTAKALGINDFDFVTLCLRTYHPDLYTTLLPYLIRESANEI